MAQHDIAQHPSRSGTCRRWMAAPSEMTAASKPFVPRSLICSTNIPARRPPKVSRVTLALIR